MKLCADSRRSTGQIEILRADRRVIELGESIFVDHRWCAFRHVWCHIRKIFATVMERLVIGYREIFIYPLMQTTSHILLYRHENASKFAQSLGYSCCNVVIVSVPPDILDYPTSTDMVVREGSNVTLRCAATGTPEPTVTWRREAGGTISLSNWHEGVYI